MALGKTNISYTKLYEKPDPLYLYSYGNEYTGNSGGWSYIYNSSSYKSGTASKQSNCLRTSEQTGDFGNTSWYTNNLIDMSMYRKLYAVVSVYDTYVYKSTNPVSASISIVKEAFSSLTHGKTGTGIVGTTVFSATSSGQSITKALIEIDISSVEEGTIRFTTSSGSYAPDKITADLFELWLE